MSCSSVSIHESELEECITSRCIKYNLPSLMNVASELIKLVDKNKHNAEVMRLEVVPVVVSMSQDVGEEVRAVSGLFLDTLALLVGANFYNSSFINIVVDLVNDTSPLVRKATFLAFSNALSSMPEDVIASYGITIAKKFIRESLSSNDGDTLSLLALLYGNLCLGLNRTTMQIEDKGVFILWFKYLSMLGLDNNRKKTLNLFEEQIEDLSEDRMMVCRIHTADNIVDMMKFCCCGIADKSGLKTLRDIYLSFICDGNYIVHTTAIKKLDQVVEYFNEEWGVLAKTLSSLLYEGDKFIVESLVPQLVKTIELAYSRHYFVHENETSIREILFALISCESKLCGITEFRLYCNLLSDIEKIIGIFDTKMFCDFLASILMKRIFTARGLPKRLSIARWLLVSLLHLKNPATVNSIKCLFLCDLKDNENFYNRLLFIKSCYIVLQEFSLEFFKNVFFNSLIELADDLVPNIRIAVANIVPYMYVTGDEKNFIGYIQQLDKTMIKLGDDMDRDVRHAIKEAIKIIAERPFKACNDNSAKMNRESNIPIHFSKNDSPQTGKWFDMAFDEAINRNNRIHHSPVQCHSLSRKLYDNQSWPKKPTDSNRFNLTSLPGSSTEPAIPVTFGVNQSITKFTNNDFSADAGTTHNQRCFMPLMDQDSDINLSGNKIRKDQRKEKTPFVPSGVPVRLKKPEKRNINQRHSTIGLVSSSSYSKPRMMNGNKNFKSRLSVDEGTLRSHAAFLQNSNSVIVKPSENLAESYDSKKCGVSSLAVSDINTDPVNSVSSERSRKSFVPKSLPLHKNKSFAKGCESGAKSSLEDNRGKFRKKFHGLKTFPTDSNKPVIHTKHRIISVVDGSIGVQVINADSGRPRTTQLVHLSDKNSADLRDLDAANNNQKEERKKSSNDVIKKQIISHLPRPSTLNTKHIKTSVSSSKLPVSRLPKKD